MGIKEDLEDAKSLWVKSTWPTKFIVVLSLFLTTSSVTSLSDVIFEWKGFILDGLVFYRTYVTENIVLLISKFGISIDQPTADIFILIGLLLAGGIRGIFGEVGELGPLGSLYSKMVGSHRKYEKHFTLLLVVLALGGVVALHLLIDEYVGPAIELILFILIISILGGLLAKNIFIRFTLPFILAVSITLILGAINAGLTKASA